MVPRRSPAVLFAALFVLSAFSGRVAAQSQYSLHGRVLDPTGAPIAGARVRVVSDGSAPATLMVASPTGEFTIALDPGRHTVSVTADGFEEVSQTILVQNAGSESRD